MTEDDARDMLIKYRAAEELRLCGEDEAAQMLEQEINPTIVKFLALEDTIDAYVAQRGSLNA